jgi:putative serine protease PepD
MNSRPASSRLRRLAPLAVAVAIGAGAGAGAYALSSNDNGNSGTSATARVVVPAQPASSTSTVDSLTQLYKADAPGVVDITVESTTNTSSSNGFPFGPSGGTQKQEAEGTGFEIDSKGNIMTAEHVVANADSITVTFQDGSTAKATLVGTPDKSTDTAVIHVDVPASKLHPLTLGNSSSVQPGQSVIAIGSPFGLQETMTAGIVSATNREITAPNHWQITNAIQTDAAINHGNSGGPLIDAATNTVIGINDQIESDTNDNSGVGFAVPIDASKKVADTLISGGTVQHAYMGIQIKGVTGGAKITAVTSGSPADRAGLKVGDVITEYAGKPITSASELQAAVFNSNSGETVTVTVQRGGSTKSVQLKLGVRPASPASN